MRPIKKVAKTISRNLSLQFLPFQFQSTNQCVCVAYGGLRILKFSSEIIQNSLKELGAGISSAAAS